MDGESAEVDAFQMSFNTIVACECVRDARKKAECPVLITCPNPAMLETVQDEFPKELVCAYRRRKGMGRYEFPS